MFESSYEKNCYGNVFRSIVLTQKPKNVVECGTLNGNSAYYISHALKFNHIDRGIESKFVSYDLWDDYEFKHGNLESVKKYFESLRLSKYVEFKKENALEAYKNHEDKSIDLLHFDISNDGDILIKMLKKWGDKISNDGIILFEGGSIERDNGWIKKYGKKSIRYELENNSIVNENWSYQLFLEYPSLTILFPKRKD
jgi:predicted O-methyltransferase YrrM